ncbi:MAG: 3-isopropylmalate dehydratase small subunit [Rhodospirillaceae bacterium]|nr:3-isopropylmalate dehydratase small subunit [Rhodospirillaceae bacterium]|tara:strand:+ start:905 stop:1540 length:636 start_codon:yes stop_codon:yes gene_type:complete
MTMEPFKKLTAIACPFEKINVDTNQICPTRFNKLPVNDPYLKKVMFHDQRFTRNGEKKNTQFIFNQDPYTKSEIIVADQNWGIGSSRESAVYALKSFGIRSVIASSFGDIHYNNLTKNGLCPVTLTQNACRDLRQQLIENVGVKITVNLEAMKVITPNGTEYSFEMHPLKRRCLLEGLDDISLTRKYLEEIQIFEANHHRSKPFLKIQNSN